MGRQRNSPQVKEQEFSPEDKLKEVDASNLSDIEFKVVIIKMFNSIKSTLNH